MLARKRTVNQDVEVIRRDAAKMVSNLSNLSRNLAESSKVRTGETVQSMRNGVERSSEMLKKEMNDLNKNTRKAVKNVDNQVHENPYTYVASAMGLGFLLGTLAGLSTGRRLSSGRRR